MPLRDQNMIIFRADGNAKLGTGHVMRCLSIADALSEKKIESVFICSDHEMDGIISERGYRSVVLDTDYTKPEDETDKLMNLPEFRDATGMVVDSYFVTPKYFITIGDKIKTIYIDDYFSPMPATGIINYNIYADRSGYENMRNDRGSTAFRGHLQTVPELILGPEYAPLRREFRDTPPIRIKEKAKKVLILSGGSDPAHVAPALAREVAERGDESMEYHFVLGTLTDSAKQLKEYETKCPGIITHIGVKDMQALMRDCDMALTAAGSTMYELCACGVPSVNFSVADNQRLGAEAFLNKNIMLSLGMVNDTKEFAKEALLQVLDLAENPEKRRVMSASAKRLVDGRGAGRIAGKLEEIFS